GLLPVVAAMAERHVRARKDLRASEETADESIAHVPESPVEGEHERIAEDERDERRVHDAEGSLLQTRCDDDVQAVRRDGGADDAEDERVTRRSRERRDESDEIPDDSADQSGGDGVMCYILRNEIFIS